MFDWLWVAIGGAAGSVLRYGTTIAVQRWTQSSWPWATFAVNILGSFLIGWLAYLVVGRGAISVQTRLIVMVGLLGGFTTFSTFSLDTLRLIQEGGWRAAAANAVLSVAGGLIAAWAGFNIASSL
ncbi:MAG TPA: fluoride efflux transporter CrcB [Nitrospinae bacterium]|nr:fluoride efflux transporter CrcB [Nitrospinota bacterium]